jgi:hypothetical protein
LMAAKLHKGFHGICDLSDETHVRLRSDDGIQPFAKNGVVFDAQYANRLGLGHLGRAPTGCWFDDGREKIRGSPAGVTFRRHPLSAL